MTGTEALVAATRRLSDAGIESAGRDARRLLAHALGIASDRVTLAAPQELSGRAEATFAAAVAARLARQPVSQITGERAFFGHLFRVSRDTLDPRPETEILVAAALEQPFVRMLDLGTGTGCILLSCLAARTCATGIGTDCSQAALEVAAENAVRLGLAGRATFRCADWFQDIEGMFDLVVSNPPYIAESEIAGLSPEVRDWEPRTALTPGGDGLDAYRAIASGAGAGMRPGARLLLEIGPTQADAVTALLRAAGFEGMTVRRDLDGRNRVVEARWPRTAGRSATA